MSDLTRHRLIPVPVIALAISASLHLSLLLLTSTPAQPGKATRLFPLQVKISRLTSLPAPPAPRRQDQQHVNPDQDAQTLPQTTNSPGTISDSSESLGDRYYEVNELDSIPRALQEIEPRFPKTGAPDVATTTIKIAVYLDETGKVVLVKPANADAHMEFVEAAEEAFKSATFEPPMVNGVKVKAVLEITVRFESGNNSTLSRPPG